MRNPLPFDPFPTGDQSRAGLSVLGDGQSEIQHGDGHLQLPDPRVEAGGPSSRMADDPDLVGLHVQNVTAAIAFGIAVGDLAIRDVLSGGRLGILGRREQR